MNEARRIIESCSRFYFAIISFTSLFKKQQENKSSLHSQTYSWNKGGIKLFLFQEYGPLLQTLFPWNMLLFFT